MQKLLLDTARIPLRIFPSVSGGRGDPGRPKVSHEAADRAGNPMAMVQWSLAKGNQRS
jgi:hypothetical protein